jgi:DNA-binding winged helix-turn-helix (wHTH) protein
VWVDFTVRTLSSTERAQSWSAGELRRNSGEAIRILLLLWEHPQEVVFREEIRKKLWPNDTVVEFEHSISAAMNRLRQALGDSGDSPHNIETLARRGSRWIVPVEWVFLSVPQRPGRILGASPSLRREGHWQAACSFSGHAV